MVRLKVKKAENYKTQFNKFQFQNGTIKRVYEIYILKHFSNFNSKMVRLKEYDFFFCLHRD